MFIWAQDDISFYCCLSEWAAISRKQSFGIAILSDDLPNREIGIIWEIV